MAPNISGTNCLTQAEDGVVELLANLTAFQSFVNVPDAGSAKERIYVHELPATLTDDSDTWDDSEWLSLFPLALITMPTDGPLFEVVQSARDLPIQYDINLRFEVLFEAFPEPSLNLQDQARVFMNHFGSILEEISLVANLEPGRFAPSAVYPSGELGRRHYAKHAMLKDAFYWGLILERVIEQ